MTRALAFTVLLALLTACGGDGGTSEAETGAAGEITISDFTFSGEPVAAGAQVTVTNQDEVAHTVTAEDGSFDVEVDGSSTATFTAPAEPGEYPYICTIHPSMMGTLTVT